MSVEVFDGSFSASQWAESHADQLVEAALIEGALDWNFVRHAQGIVFEVKFEDEEAWQRFQASLSMRWALDAAPDPHTGVIIYRGRGGNPTIFEPRRPKPKQGSGANALPIPVSLEQELFTEAFGAILDYPASPLAGANNRFARSA